MSERSLEVVSQEYIRACANLGELYYRQITLPEEINKLAGEIAELHKEAQKFKKESEAK